MNRGLVAVQHCGLARRLLVITYDSVIVVGLLLAAAALASPLDRGNQHALRDPVFTLYLLGVWYLYLAWCWQHGGMTVGMRAWGVRLHSTDGSRPGWWTSLVRFAVALASAACVGLGFAWSLFDGQRRCWHDIASNTGLFRETRTSD
ncbi:MAG: RDD family protein [Xanthomonadales bacterium]|nr:RDD family protein [Xanthomonadales bacterium]